MEVIHIGNAIMVTQTDVSFARNVMLQATSTQYETSGPHAGQIAVFSNYEGPNTVSYHAPEAIAHAMNSMSRGDVQQFIGTLSQQASQMLSQTENAIGMRDSPVVAFLNQHTENLMNAPSVGIVQQALTVGADIARNAAATEPAVPPRAGSLLGGLVNVGTETAIQAVTPAAPAAPAPAAPPAPPQGDLQTSAMNAVNQLMSQLPEGLRNTLQAMGSSMVAASHNTVAASNTQVAKETNRSQGIG